MQSDFFFSLGPFDIVFARFTNENCSGDFPLGFLGGGGHGSTPHKKRKQ